MSNLSSFLAAAGKPKLITLYTSGTGTYVPTEDMARCLVRVQAGGGAGGGHTSGVHYAGGGSAGAMVEAFMRLPIGGTAWIVGAGGVGGPANVMAAPGGSASHFGVLYAMPGVSSSNTGPASGGYVGLINGRLNTTGITAVVGAVSGVSGGHGAFNGANANYAGPAGWPHCGTTQNFPYVAPLSPIIPSLNPAAAALGYPGGDSFFGRGGAAPTSATNGNSGTGYGSGGSTASGTLIAGNGAGGCIEIWDFGA